MEIEIPAWLYEMLLNEATETDSTIEKIVEFASKNLWRGMMIMSTNEKKGITVKVDAEIKQ